MYDYPQVEINIDNLFHNINIIKQMSPTKKLLAIIKGNAYGHGIIEIAKALSLFPALCTVDGFGVGRLVDGIQLRKAGIKAKIVILEGVSHPEHYSLAQEYQLDIVIRCRSQLTCIKRQSLTGLTIWLNINSGMNFGDLELDEIVLHYASLMDGGATSVILMTQFPQSRDFTNPMTYAQADRFSELTSSFNVERSTMSSSDLLNFTAIESDWLRVGYMMYGYHHMHDENNHFKKIVANLKPLHTLKSCITQILDLSSNMSIGYDNQPTHCQARKIAIVQIGFGDGYPRNMAQGTAVMINDQQASITGSITMDKIAVDITGLANPNIGDTVVLWNKDLSIHAAAKACDHNPIELICRVSDKVTSQYVFQNQIITL